MSSQDLPPAYVVLEGELDLFRRNDIQASFPDLSNVSSVTVNCVRATYVDSAVLGMLVGFRREFVAAGGDPDKFVLLLAKDGIVHRSCEIAGLTKLFAVAFAEESDPQRKSERGIADGSPELV